MMDTAEKLAQLRQALHAQGADGFILPMADEFLSEYVPAFAARLQWLSGFTGSAGTVVVLPKEAAFFTDGRYTLQAATELDAALFAVHNAAEVSVEQWLKRHITLDRKIGFDPKLHSANDVKKITAAVEETGGALVALQQNPVDRLWQDRPMPSAAPAFIHDISYVGEASHSKRQRAAAALVDKKADAAMLTVPESVNWLLNIRGADVEFTPVLQCYALLYADGQVVLYADPAKITQQVKEHLGAKVQVKPFSALKQDIGALGAAHKRLLVDPAESSFYFAHIANEAGVKVIEAADPCAALKACKSAVELQGMRRAHVQDGVAVVKFLHWLEGALAAGETVSEVAAAEQLLSLRADREGFLHPSFATIAGSGPNGAIVHYRATGRNQRNIQQNELFLLDSGGQYAYGTTDITRTLAIGVPTYEQKERFTQVLKGHIALARAKFPQGTTGSQLDALARQYLWQAGADYDHGTGHGVGYCLGVHEGPQRISKRGGDVALQQGMILSNEPGYYKAGEYGIRIENLVAVAQSVAGERPFLQFETLTCVPIDVKLVEVSLLTAQEKAWLNDYHAWVLKTLAPVLEEQEVAWLKRACNAI